MLFRGGRRAELLPLGVPTALADGDKLMLSSIIVSCIMAELFESIGARSKDSQQVFQVAPGCVKLSVVDQSVSWLFCFVRIVISKINGADVVVGKEWKVVRCSRVSKECICGETREQGTTVWCG